MNISELIKKAHQNAVEKGFYDCPECGGTGEIIVKEEDRDTCPTCGAKGKGKNQNKNIGELLMLIVSELGEALEAHRKENETKRKIDSFDLNKIDMMDFKNFVKDTFEDELADVAIRLFDLCGYLNIDLEKHIELKMKYNETRPHKHGKKY